jgi:citrate/tricarballylate utilization protein
VPQLTDPLQEGERLLTICNACRYCEGYCAMFPAMERRLVFTEADLNYLSNLCHNCSECYYACQYAPPHEYALNLPRTLAQIRLQTYQKYAWPAPLARAFQKNGLVVSLIVLVSVAAAIFSGAALAHGGGLLKSPGAGQFYRIIPHNVMVAAFGLVSIFLLIAFIVGFVRFWRETGEGFGSLFKIKTLAQGLSDTLSLKYMSSAGAGCTYPGEERSMSRRWFHHLTFYGFALCFASTSVAAFYSYVLGWEAPYGYLSLPVILGTVGGIGLLIGPAGLLFLKGQRNPETGDPAQSGMDTSFIVLLFVTSLTGLLLLALRHTSAMGLLLVIHLGAVLVLFLTLPYGKFVHGIYRTAALVRNAIESERPSVGLGE